MAQFVGGASKGTTDKADGDLARRLGLTGRASVAIACIVLLVALASFGAVRSGLLPTTGFLVERGNADLTNGVEQASTEEAEIIEAHTQVTVHVDGAVNAPGVVRLEGDDLRIVDAIEAVGGLSEDADTSTINLAATLEDGLKVYIPHKGEAEIDSVSNLTLDSSPQLGSAPAAQDSGKVNVNTADIDELVTLPGIGDATAAAIIDERTAGGPFTSVDDLLRVNGIGEKRLEKIRGHVSV